VNSASHDALQPEGVQGFSNAERPARYHAHRQAKPSPWLTRYRRPTRQTSRVMLQLYSDM
jgi:hypothetical protein